MESLHKEVNVLILYTRELEM